MSDRVKKIALVALFVASVLAIGVGIYWAFFRPAPPPATVGPGNTGGTTGGLPTSGNGGQNVVPPTNTPPGTLPPPSPVANGGITKTTILTPTSVSNVQLASDGQSMNYYDPADGKFYAIDNSGDVIRLSDKKFPSVSSVAWNKDANEAVLEFPDGSNVVYDFASETQVTLPEHWEDFEFSPATNQLFAKSVGLDPDNRELVISDDDGSHVEAIQALGNNADKVQVNPSPNDQVVAFSATGDAMSSFDRQMIIPIGKNDENYKGLIVEGLGFDARWNPRGDTILYSVSGTISDYRPLLWVTSGSTNTLGDDRRSLGINTWVDKCTFSDNTTIYCGVPRSLEPNAGLSRSLAAGTPDDVYKIDLANGRATLIARPDKDTDMANLSVSADDSTLFFSNAQTGQLESIKLK